MKDCRGEERSEGQCGRGGRYRDDAVRAGQGRVASRRRRATAAAAGGSQLAPTSAGRAPRALQQLCQRQEQRLAALGNLIILHLAECDGGGRRGCRCCRDAGGASRQGGQEQGRGGLPIRRCSSRRRVAQAGAGTHPLPAFTLVGLCVLRHRPLCRLGAAEDCRCRAQRGERPARRAADLQEGRGSPCEPPCWGQSHRRLQPKNKIIIIGVPVT